MGFANAANAIEKDRENTEENQDQKDDVEQPPAEGFVAEDNFAPAITPRCAEMGYGLRFVHDDKFEAGGTGESIQQTCHQIKQEVENVA